MTIEDVLRLQRNHAMDAAAQAAVVIEQLQAELAALRSPAPEPVAVPHLVPRQAAKMAGVPE